MTEPTNAAASRAAASRAATRAAVTQTKRAKRAAKAGPIQQHFRPAFHNRDASAELPSDVFEMLSLAVLPGPAQVKTVLALGCVSKAACEGVAGALGHVLARIEAARQRLQTAHDAELDPLRTELAAVPEARVRERQVVGLIQPVPADGDDARLAASLQYYRAADTIFFQTVDAHDGGELSPARAAIIAAATEAGDDGPWSRMEESKNARLAYARLLEEMQVPLQRLGHAVLFGSRAPALRTRRQLLSLLLSKCDNCGVYAECNGAPNTFWCRYAPVTLFCCEHCYRDAHLFFEMGATTRAEKSPTAAVCRELWIRPNTTEGAKLVRIAVAHDARAKTATAPTRVPYRGARVLSGRAGTGTRVHDVKAHVGGVVSLGIQQASGLHLWLAERLEPHAQAALAPELAQYGAVAVLLGDAPKAATAASAALRAELADAMEQFARTLR